MNYKLQLIGPNDQASITVPKNSLKLKNGVKRKNLNGESMTEVNWS